MSCAAMMDVSYGTLDSRRGRLTILASFRKASDLIRFPSIVISEECLDYTLTSDGGCAINEIRGTTNYGILTYKDVDRALYGKEKQAAHHVSERRHV